MLEHLESEPTEPAAQAVIDAAHAYGARTDRALAYLVDSRAQDMAPSTRPLAAVVALVLHPDQET